MHIYHKKNKVTTECHNEDVIAHAKKQVNDYIVKGTLEELKKEIAELDKKETDVVKKKSLGKMNRTELNEVAEKLELNEYEGLTNAELIEVIKQAQTGADV